MLDERYLCLGVVLEFWAVCKVNWGRKGKKFAGISERTLICLVSIISGTFGLMQCTFPGVVPCVRELMSLLCTLTRVWVWGRARYWSMPCEDWFICLYDPLFVVSLILAEVKVECWTLQGSLVPCIYVVLWSLLTWWRGESWAWGSVCIHGGDVPMKDSWPSYSHFCYLETQRPDSMCLKRDLCPWVEWDVVCNILNKILNQRREIGSSREYGFYVQGGGYFNDANWGDNPCAKFFSWEFLVRCDMPFDTRVAHSPEYVRNSPNILKASNHFMPLLFIFLVSK